MARVLAGTSPERTSRLMIIGAVVFAALAALLVFIALQKNGGGSKSSSAAAQDVVVAKQDIGVNTKITSDMIQVKSLPSDQVIGGAYATTQSLIGLPARYPIQAGEQVTSAKIGIKAIEQENDLSLVLTGGQRAFSVQASELKSVGGLLLPGNSVDVIAVYSDQSGGTQAVTVLQNILLLSVAQEAEQPVPAASDTTTPVSQATPGLQGQRPSDVKRHPDAQSVTLAVTPDQAQLLAGLQSRNNVSIWLSLRPASDQAPTNLLPSYSPPIPTPAP